MAIHSHLSAVSKLAPESSEKGNALQAELSAMQDIAFALSTLDEPTRARVLRWVDERFRSDVPIVSPPSGSLYAVCDLPIVTAPGKGADDALNAFFDLCDADEPKLLKDAPVVVPTKSVPGMLNDFVADFQDIVREWNVACSESDEESVEPVTPAVPHEAKSQRASKVV
jgi:hypothetical protein